MGCKNLLQDAKKIKNQPFFGHMLRSNNSLEKLYYSSVELNDKHAKNREADSIPTDAILTVAIPTDSVPSDSIPTNAISAEMHVDRHVITLYIHIHQGATITCVMK